jgi:3-hydroxyisobutyrate dehydrogenase
MIAILGTGLLGAAFARALRGRGESVRVWNRSRDKAAPLAAVGIEVCDEPAAAIVGASRTHVVLSDDAAVDEVLARARPGTGAWIIDHTTTSTAGAVGRTQRWREHGVTYLHAPVFMGPGNAESGTGLMLVSGDRDVVAAATPWLSGMTGSLVDLGPRVDAAAGLKLVGNLLLMALTAGFADMLALGKAMGVSPGDVAALLHHFNPGASLPARLQRLIAAPYDAPSWTLAMARKDAALIQAECDRGGVALGVLPTILARMDALVAQGLGDKDWTVYARDSL